MSDIHYTDQLDENNGSSPKTDFLIAQYQALANRQSNYSSLLWSVPTMLFVGQTLLWNIALDNGLNNFFKFLISIVALMVSIISFQLFLRTKVMQIADSKQLYSIENYMSDTGNSSIIINNTLKKRSFMPSEKNESFFQNQLGADCGFKNKIFFKASNINSFTLWIISFISFMAVSAMICIYNFYCLLGC